MSLSLSPAFQSISDLVFQSILYWLVLMLQRAKMTGSMAPWFDQLLGIDPSVKNSVTHEIMIKQMTS